MSKLFLSLYMGLLLATIVGANELKKLIPARVEKVANCTAMFPLNHYQLTAHIPCHASIVGKIEGLGSTGTPTLGILVENYASPGDGTCLGFTSQKFDLYFSTAISLKKPTILGAPQGLKVIKGSPQVCSTKEERPSVLEARESLVNELRDKAGFIGTGIENSYILLYVTYENTSVVQHFKAQFGDSYMGYPVKIVDTNGGFGPQG